MCILYSAEYTRRREHQNIQRGACIQANFILIRTMSDGFGDSQTCSFVFNEGKSSVHAHSTHSNKMATCGFGPVTVISCERALFFIYIWIISWDATNNSLKQH